VTIAPHRDDAPGAGSAEAARLILEERARVLARPLAPDTDGDGVILLGFTVAGSAYAIEVIHVREVLVQADVSRLPWAPPAIAGVINVRGEIVAVANTARVLGVGDTDSGGPVIVLDGSGHPLGLRVDAVDAITTIAARQLVAPEGDSIRAAGDLMLGLTSSAVVLDPRALYTDPRLTNHPQEPT